MKVKTVMALVIAFIFMASVSVSAAPDMTHADSLKELKDQKIIESTLKTPSEKAKYTFEVTDKIKTDAKSTITVSTEKGNLKLKSKSGKHEVQNLQIAYSLLAPYIVNGAVRLEHKTDSGITDAVWVQKVRNDNGYVYFDNMPFSEIIIGGYTGTYTKTGILNYNVSNVFNLGSSFHANSTNFINASVEPEYEEESPYNIPTDGLVGWWKFDEGSGVNVTDSSGNGNHGTATGMNWTDGKYNGAGSFDGVDDYVIVPASTLFNYSDFTWFAVVSRGDTSDTAIISLGEYNVAGYELYISNTDKVIYRTYQADAKQSTEWITPTPPISNTHLCIRVTNNVPELYINGVIASKVGNTVHQPPAEYIGDLGIGKRGVGAVYYAGAIDNVIMYNRALSESEIKQIYYDSLRDVQLKTNSNAEYSTAIDSGEISIPYSEDDADITSFTAYVPKNVTIGGVTVRDYNRTVTPFTLTATVGYTENTTLVSESIVNNVYNLNISYTPAVNSTGNLSFTTTELSSYDWLGNMQLDSDDSEAMVSSWNATNFEIQTGNLIAEQTYEYNISVDVCNVPVAEFEASNTIGYHTITAEFTDLSTNSPTSWLWDFGDGSTSTSQNPTHTYAAGGYYTVTLTATNAAGHDTETKTDVIHVIPPVQDTIDSSFVDSWHDTLSLVGAIIIVTLAGSAIMVFKGRKSMLDVGYDMQGIVLVLVLMVLGAIIFGQF